MFCKEDVYKMRFICKKYNIQVNLISWFVLPKENSHEYLIFEQHGEHSFIFWVGECVDKLMSG
jgi:hypothetical protein